MLSNLLDYHKSNVNNHNIFYIIEGNVMDYCLKNKELMQKTLFSSMLSLSYKKGFSLLHTSGMIETAEFLIRFIEKLETDSKIKKPISTDIEEPCLYSNTLKTAKKSNITKGEYWRNNVVTNTMFKYNSCSRINEKI